MAGEGSISASASTALVDQIQEDHLTCRICYCQYVQPKALPCLHSFCLECLHTYITRQGYDKTLPCPICRKNVKIPKARAKGFPDNHLLVSLLDTLENPPPAAQEPPDNLKGDTISNHEMTSGNQETSAGRGGSRVSPPGGTLQTAVPSIAVAVRHIEPSAPELSLSPPPSPPPPYQLEDPSPPYTPRAQSPEQPTETPPMPGQTPRTSSIYSLHQQMGLPTMQTSYPSEVMDGDQTPPVTLEPMELDYDFCNDALPEEYFFLSCCGRYGPGLYDFSRPTGLGVLRDGKIAVSDQRDNRIIIFNSDGTVYSMFVCNANIRDLVIAHDDTIIVVVNKSAVNMAALAHIYTINGDLVSTIGKMFTYLNPYGLTITPVGKTSLIATDITQGKVYVVNDKGKMTSQFGSRGSDERHFKKPFYVCTKSGLIYVSDAEHNSIKVFNMLGEFKHQFGGGFRTPAILNNPQGICTDNQGNIIVADTGNHSVQIFSPDGRFLQTFLTYNEQENSAQTLRPLNVAMTRGGNLVVLVIAAGFAQVRTYYYTPVATPVLQSMTSMCQIL